MMLLFLVIAALLVAVLIIVAVKPLLWLDYERRWTGIDRRPLITNQARFVMTTRLIAILVIVGFVAFVFGIINFDSVFESQGSAHRQLLQQQLERDREAREGFRNRPGLVPPPLEPEQPQR